MIAAETIAEIIAEIAETQEIATIIIETMVGIPTIIITTERTIMDAGIHLVPTNDPGVEVRLK